MRIVKSIHFDAAHYLDHDPDGRPSYARVHGHSFRLEVEIEGIPDRKTGWVADFADVALELGNIGKVLDHNLLNEIAGLECPTLENICIWVADRLSGRFPGLRTVRCSRPSAGESCIYDIVRPAPESALPQMERAVAVSSACAR